MSILNVEARTMVLDLLDKSAQDKHAAAFMDTVSNQLVTIQALKTSLENTFTDGNAQDQIGSLLEHAQRFRKQMESLDPEIQPVLSLYLHTPTPYTVSSGEISESVVNLERHLDVLVSRLELITSLQSGGGSRNWLERYLWYPLIRDIIYAHWEHFGAYPSVQKGAVIEEVLRVLLAIIIEPPDDLHGLVVEAVDRLKSSEAHSLKDT